MSDAMDSDVREVIRRRIALRERDGHERLLLNHVDLRALLDAADERDRIKAELGDPSRHYIMDGWLVIDTGRHTCGTGPGGHYGTHEPGCGLEQALRLDNLPGWPGDERDRLAAQVERVRALAEWHETEAMKARRFRIEINGEIHVMDKAADVHYDAARRIRRALDGTDYGPTPPTSGK